MAPSRPSRKAQIIRAVVVISIVIGCLRETGHLNLNLYSARSSASSTSGSASSASHAARPSASALGKPAAVITKTQGDPQLAKYVQEAIEGLPGTKPPVQIVIKTLHTDGAYWLPLYKSGVCSYKIQMADGNPKLNEAAGDTNGVYYTISLDGQINEQITGVCSAYHFQELVGQEVGKQVRDALEKYENAPADKA